MIEEYTGKTLSQLRDAQHRAFHTDKPWSAFAVASETLDGLDDEKPVLALGLQFDRAVVYDRRGIAKRHVVVKDEQDGERVELDKGVLLQGHRGWLVDLGTIPGAVPCVAEIDGARYGAGLMIVAGPGNTGKTPLLHAIATHLVGEEKYACVRFGEPLSGYVTDFDELVMDIAHGLLQHRVIVIDSLKDVIGNAGGNATSSGIARGAWQLLSDLGSLAASRGSLIIAALNPTSNDPRIVDLVNEAVRSNSTSLVVPGSQAGQWTVVTRTGEGLQRLTHEIRVKYTDNVAQVVGTIASGVSKTEVTRIQSKIDPSDMEAVLRRFAPETKI